MNKLKQPLNKVLLLPALLFLVGCSNTRFVPDGDFLYTGASINIIHDSLDKTKNKKLEGVLKDNLTPKPNKSFFGLRPKLYIYNITSKPKKDKGFKYWLKNKVGEKPVYLSDVDIPFNLDIIENTAENMGYFNVSASYDTVSKNKKAQITYNVSPRTQYLINKVTFPADSTVLAKQITHTASKSLLKVNEPFDLNVIKAERERIDMYLKENGFYYFDPDNLIIQVDSTAVKHKVNLNVKVKDNTPELAKDQFTIDKIYVFSDYNLRSSRRRQGLVRTDTDTILWKDNVFIIDPKNKFRPQIYDRALYFKSGDLYNRTNHNLTLNRLINLGTFKFVKNQFVLSDSLANKFDVYYYLTPNDFKSLRLETLAKSNSASFVGGEVNLNWRHRNFLRGAELFTGSLYTAIDFQLGGNEEAKNIYRVGSKFSLTWPRIIAPFKFHSSSAFVPRTRVEVGYEYQNRTQEYILHNFNASFGYLWKENALREHDLKIIDITYVTPEFISEEYQSKIDRNDINSEALKRVVDKQLIFGPVYSYTFTNTMLPKKHTFYYKGMLDLSANITGLIMGANAQNNNQKTVLGVPFSQYVKTEHDFRYYLKLNDNSQIATRFIGGIAYPYGNSLHVPFSKQFFVGGSNSVRAFRARTLGPGSYLQPQDGSASYFNDQSGDIKLEGNVEYRTKLVSFLNLGVFVDAGNVWLLNEEENRPGGTFGKDFLSEIAVGAGVGLRFDFSILILRTDFAFPIRVPSLPKGDRWNFNEINFSDKQWRRDNLILNIAIGYPF